jgi:hypothetical protein
MLSDGRPLVVPLDGTGPTIGDDGATGAGAALGVTAG